jgi:Family of unknown function (DUF5989)
MRAFLADFLRYLRENKVLWLVPVALLGLLVGAALLLSPSSALAPVVYQH